MEMHQELCNNWVTTPQRNSSQPHKNLKKITSEDHIDKLKMGATLVETATTDSCGSDGGSLPGETSVYNFHPVTCNFQAYFHIYCKGITQCF